MRAIDADALEELFREVIGGIAKKPEMNGNLEHMVRASAMVIEMIQDAPTIEPEPHHNEWCTDCKEYDQERHCCPRFNRVIRSALKDAQPEIIRCKDCEWRNGSVCLNNNTMPWSDDDFCSNAERRTDE